ncbi:MAG: DUF885 domain-containing protein [Micromonosporaceae bacterium]
MRPIDQIADRYVDQFAALHPIAATFAGVAGHDDTMTDFTPAGFAARMNLDRATLEALRSAEPVDEREQAAREAMIERLELQQQRYDAGHVTSALNVIDSPLQDIQMVFDLMPTAGDDAIRNVAARLSQTPQALAGYRETLREAAADGRVSARRQVLACAKTAQDWADRRRDNLWGKLIAGLPAEGALRAELERHAAAAAEATADFGRFLTDELLPKAPAPDACGRERYALESRAFLGAEVDLEETYAWGWEELAAIEAEMRQVAERIVPGGSTDDAIAALNADPHRRIIGKEPFQRWMQDLADRAIDELHGRHFDIPELLRRIECRIAPTSTGGIYYTGPSEDFSRTGRMWWSVPSGVDDFGTWQQTTTVYHEGVPGHHLQIGQTAYRRELLNRWQRQLCWVSGHGEGWALYAERLMADLGYLDDPGDRMGMLCAQGFRATRVIIDIGMHLELPIPKGAGFHEGEVWTPELGWEFLLAHGRMPTEEMRFELDRYLGWPGQAPSYKVGERIWLQARADAERRAGAGFNLKEFHRAALDLGSIGLDPLRRALERL